ncbi:MAG: recombinase family protein [Acidobacteriaceae bacterium]
MCAVQKTSLGMSRLTLNVLLSFAQFEREVTGERIRDKIAASKRKGMWMGGTVPLGYDVRDRKLYINDVEAQRVRLIFNQFLRLGNVKTLKEWLRENGIRSKKWNHYDSGALYRMLHNPLYIGLIRHKKDTYPGEHPSILDRDIWEKVQTLLTENQQGKHRKPRSTKRSLLTGILYDGMARAVRQRTRASRVVATAIAPRRPSSAKRRKSRSPPASRHRIHGTKHGNSYRRQSDDRMGHPGRERQLGSHIIQQSIFRGLRSDVLVLVER